MTPLFLSLLTLTSACFANTCNKNPNHTYNCSTAPHIVVDCLLTDLVDQKTTLQSKETSQKKFDQAVNSIVTEDILPSLDIDSMAARIVGRYNWKNSPESEKERLRVLLQDITIQEYSDFIRKLDKNYPIKFYPSRRVNKENTQIYGIMQDGKKAITIGFYMSCKVPDSSKIEAWQINDLTVENISFIDQMRLSLAATVRNDGLKGLNDKLEAELTKEN